MKHYVDLLEESFPGIKNNIIRCETLGFFWEASKLFIKEVKGNVISHAALLVCPILIEGQWHKIGALHGICTHQAYRGQGLATDLIQEALQWSKEHCEAVLLFTEISAFYERLSFRRVQEYRFHLHLRSPRGSQSLKAVIAPDDNDLFLRCFRDREPLFNLLWIKEDGLIASFNTLFATYPTYWSIYYCPIIDGLISYQLKDKTLHLLDVVASKLPSLDVILDHLPAAIEDIYFYFSPDRFTDKAVAEPYLYDNGNLLIYGQWPISKPFMIPPLSRC